MASGPVPNVVPAVVLQAVHEEVRIRPLCKVPLDRLVGAVGATDEDLKALFNHRVGGAASFAWFAEPKLTLRLLQA